MPALEIHADYDRDGQLTTSRAEYQGRQRQPGAIVIANLDLDRRTLPSRIVESRVPELDVAARVKERLDDEPLRLRIIVDRSHLPAGRNYFLKLVGWNASRARIYDQNRQLIRPHPELRFFNQFPITLHAGAQDFFLEVSTLPGSPLAHASSLSTRSQQREVVITSEAIRRRLDGAARIRIPGIDEGVLQIQLLSQEQPGQFHLEDSAYFTIAPLLFIDNTAIARRIYICSAAPSFRAQSDPRPQPENYPSIADLSRGLQVINRQRREGIPTVDLQIVPFDIHLGDTWMQDQMQIGYCQAPDHWTYMILHMPRRRSNVIDPEPGQNLQGFVQSHFPSRGIALFHDFWQRGVPIQDVRNQTTVLSFDESYLLFQVLQSVVTLHGLLSAQLHHLRPVARTPGATPQFSEQRRQLDALLRQIEQMVRALPEDTDTTRRKQVQTALLARNRRLLQEVSSRIVPQQEAMRVQIVLETGTTSRRINITVSDAVIDQLEKRLQQLHSSLNYGGNLEVSPPHADARFGKLVIGNVTTEDNEEQADTDLLSFLQKQGQQPLVHINTDWLHVGHVDEMMTFVSHAGSEQRFAILYASPRVAMDILDKALDLHNRGLPLDHYYKGRYRFSPILPRTTGDGAHPITHMLRGKEWLHHHPREAVQFLEPPLVYIEMATNRARSPFGHYIPFEPGPGPDRHYPANISAYEFEFFEGGTNQEIEERFVGELQEVLSREFRGVEQVGLPVLFDTMPDVEHDRTSAFTPNIVNMQVINTTLFIPRPYGPRMRPADAMTVLEQVLDQRYRSHLNIRFIQRRELHKTYHWCESRVLTGSLQSDLTSIATIFRDGFAESRPLNAIEEHIRRANRGAFDRNDDLTAGWHKLYIPENTVDLFELYTEIVLAPIGVAIVWVDSWFYHIRLGEIHCGTNVIRQPNLRRRPAWWHRSASPA